MAEPTLDLQSIHAYLKNGSCIAVAATEKIFTIPAHSAGDFINCYLPQHPIADANGSDVACKGSTSLVLTLATGFVREVAHSTLDADMINGDYWINYYTGHIHCKAATTSTAATANYNIFKVSIDATITTSAPTTWSSDFSVALEASTVSKASAGKVRLYSGRIDSTAPTATYYLQALNASSLPVNGAVTFLSAPTKLVHTTGTDTPINIDYTDNGITAATGIVFCLSSTEFTKTISGAYLSGTVLYA